MQVFFLMLWVKFANFSVFSARHNEGFKGAVAVPAHIRHTRRGDQSVRQHTRRVNIPRRQFIGDARELETELQKRIETYVESVLNN